ncbi:MAG: hypothetical protein PHT32_06440, partial [Candidatus Omnitrophica bacterium]|nr:hypothetical protein [Candidatus Omnitrophota bacterium]
MKKIWTPYAKAIIDRIANSFEKGGHASDRILSVGDIDILFMAGGLELTDNVVVQRAIIDGVIERLKVDSHYADSNIFSWFSSTISLDVTIKRAGMQILLQAMSRPDTFTSLLGLQNDFLEKIAKIFVQGMSDSDEGVRAITAQAIGQFFAVRGMKDKLGYTFYGFNGPAIQKSLVNALNKAASSQSETQAVRDNAAQSLKLTPSAASRDRAPGSTGMHLSDQVSESDIPAATLAPVKPVTFDSAANPVMRDALLQAVQQFMSGAMTAEDLDAFVTGIAGLTPDQKTEFSNTLKTVKAQIERIRANPGNADVLKEAVGELVKATEVLNKTYLLTNGLYMDWDTGGKVFRITGVVAIDGVDGGYAIRVKGDPLDAVSLDRGISYRHDRLAIVFADRCKEDARTQVRNLIRNGTADFTLFESLVPGGIRGDLPADKKAAFVQAMTKILCMVLKDLAPAGSRLYALACAIENRVNGKAADRSLLEDDALVGQLTDLLGSAFERQAAMHESMHVTDTGTGAIDNVANIAGEITAMLAGASRGADARLGLFSVAMQAMLCSDPNYRRAAGKALALCIKNLYDMKGGEIYEASHALLRDIVSMATTGEGEFRYDLADAFINFVNYIEKNATKNEIRQAADRATQEIRTDMRQAGGTAGERAGETGEGPALTKPGLASREECSRAVTRVLASMGLRPHQVIIHWSKDRQSFIVRSKMFKNALYQGQVEHADGTVKVTQISAISHAPDQTVLISPNLLADGRIDRAKRDSFAQLAQNIINNFGSFGNDSAAAMVLANTNKGDVYRIEGGKNVNSYVISDKMMKVTVSSRIKTQDIAGTFGRYCGMAGADRTVTVECMSQGGESIIIEGKNNKIESAIFAGKVTQSGRMVHFMHSINLLDAAGNLDWSKLNTVQIEEHKGYARVTTPMGDSNLRIKYTVWDSGRATINAVIAADGSTCKWQVNADGSRSIRLPGGAAIGQMRTHDSSGALLISDITDIRLLNNQLSMRVRGTTAINIPAYEGAQPPAGGRGQQPAQPKTDSYYTDYTVIGDRSDGKTMVVDGSVEFVYTGTGNNGGFTSLHAAEGATARYSLTINGVLQTSDIKASYVNDLLIGKDKAEKALRETPNAIGGVGFMDKQTTINTMAMRSAGESTTDVAPSMTSLGMFVMGLELRKVDPAAVSDADMATLSQGRPVFGSSLDNQAIIWRGIAHVNHADGVATHTVINPDGTQTLHVSMHFAAGVMPECHLMGDRQFDLRDGNLELAISEAGAVSLASDTHLVGTEVGRDEELTVYAKGSSVMLSNDGKLTIQQATVNIDKLYVKQINTAAGGAGPGGKTPERHVATVERDANGVFIRGEITMMQNNVVCGEGQVFTFGASFKQARGESIVLGGFKVTSTGRDSIMVNGHAVNGDALKYSKDGMAIGRKQDDIILESGQRVTDVFRWNIGKTILGIDGVTTYFGEQVFTGTFKNALEMMATLNLITPQVLTRAMGIASPTGERMNLAQAFS